MVQSSLVALCVDVLWHEFDLGTAGRKLCSCVLASASYGTPLRDRLKELIFGHLRSWFGFRRALGRPPFLSAGEGRRGHFWALVEYTTLAFGTGGLQASTNRGTPLRYKRFS